LTFDKAGGAHRCQNAVRCRRVQFGGKRQLFQAGGIRRGGERIEQRHHALDDLYGAGRFAGSADSFRQLDSFIGVV